MATRKRDGSPSGTMATANSKPLPLQPPKSPILCGPYDEPTRHWRYDTSTGAASEKVPVTNTSSAP